MRSASIITVSAFAALASAQFPAGFPACGNLCISNMLALAPSLGCATPEAACLCKNTNFAYGIRDCSNAACSPADATAVQAYGAQYCAAAGVILPSATVTTTATTSVPTSSVDVTSSLAVAGSSAITTSALSGLVTSAGSTFSTIVGSTTILAGIGGSASSVAASAASSAASAGSSAASVISASVSSVASAASSTAASVISSGSSHIASSASSAASAASSAASHATSAVASATTITSTSSAGGAARQTAIAGLGAAAALAAFVL